MGAQQKKKKKKKKKKKLGGGGLGGLRPAVAAAWPLALARAGRPPLFWVAQREGEGLGI